MGRTPMFYLDDSQLKRISDWIKEKQKDNRSTGAIGGRFTYNFTPTTIGAVVVVIDNLTKEELDVSDYESW